MPHPDEARALARDLANGRLGRRDFVRRATALGLSAPAVAALLAESELASPPAANATPAALESPLAMSETTAALEARAAGNYQSAGAIRREELRGTWALEREAQLPGARANERAGQQRLFGLEPAAGVNDRNLTLFRRDRWGLGNSGTFTGAPYLEDMRQLGGQHVAFVGAPLDTGTTFRTGTRFGPQELRRISTLGGSYNPERGFVLPEALDMVDVGDIQMIPGNLEKSFGQITKAIGYIAERQVVPIVLGGDHSINYPNLRGLAPFIGGKLGIIHIDRHSDLNPSIWDERMHGTPFYYSTDLPNVPPANLVQIGIGGWTNSRPGIRVARERGVTVITIDDLDRFGVESVMDYALEVAWRGARAVWLSFDIDAVDPAYAPGTGTPEPGGLTPREAMRIVRLAAREGLAGMELVEVSPPYDVADITSLLGGRIIMETLSALVEFGKLGRPQ